MSAPPPTTVAVLSVGSNMGDRLAHLATVVDGLVASGDVVQAISSVYVTPPWGGVEQNDFYNVTMVVSGPRTALDWLRRGTELETAADRRREVRWGPRTLDVDVIAVHAADGTAVFSDTDELTLPHPRAHERGFVLIPWLDADVDAVLEHRDGTSTTVADLIGALAPEELSAITALDVVPPWKIPR